MDPNAAVLAANRAIARKDWRSAREYLLALSDWLHGGGFAPREQIVCPRTAPAAIRRLITGISGDAGLIIRWTNESVGGLFSGGLGGLAGSLYEERRAAWAARSAMPPGGPPPQTTNVLDAHGGFTAETSGPQSGTNTLWRPGDVLRGNTRGTLVSFNPRSFYQQNSNVTRAVYKVSGYRYPVILWFDNATGQRIA